MTENRTRSIGKHGRTAIVAGLRTPFARIGTHFRDHKAVDLGAMVISELLRRQGLVHEQVEQVIFGMTVMVPETPFIAREIVLASGMNPRTDAYSITRACATSLQTIACADDSIQLGHAGIVIAGGTDSTSNVRLSLSERMSSILRDISLARNARGRLRGLLRLRPGDMIPSRPAITEYSTGKLMGESAEQMARGWGITRQEQDDFAHASHVKAEQAWLDGKMEDDVMAAPLNQHDTEYWLHEDNLIRRQSNRADYARLPAVFDKQSGSVTAGNASPLTDGAAALLLMNEARARALGYTPLAYLRAHAFAAKSPNDDMLMGPVLAIPAAMEKAGVSLKDFTLVDMHEAFAAQVVCNLRGLDSAAYMKRHLGCERRVGEVDRDKLNVLGGSLAYGHPFAATGARLVLQTASELKRRGGGLALISACAAGGIGGAMVIESE